MCSKMAWKKTLFGFGFTAQQSESNNIEKGSHPVHNHDVATNRESFWQNVIFGISALVRVNVSVFFQYYAVFLQGIDQ